MAKGGRPSFLNELQDKELKAKLEKHFADVRKLLEDSKIEALVLPDGQTFKGGSE